MKLDIEDIYKKYCRLVFKYAYINTGFNKERAQDITQEVFLEAIKSLKNFDSKKGNVKVWLMGIARNITFKEYKKVQNNLDLDLIKDEIKEDIEDNQLEYITLFSELEKLENMDKELITLRFVTGLSFKEISLITNLSVVNCKVKVHRILKSLNKSLSYEK